MWHTLEDHSDSKRGNLLRHTIAFIFFIFKKKQGIFDNSFCTDRLYCYYNLCYASCGSVTRMKFC